MPLLAVEKNNLTFLAEPGILAGSFALYSIPLLPVYFSSEREGLTLPKHALPLKP